MQAGCVPELCGVALTVDFTVGGAHDFTQYEMSIMANGKLSELSMDFAVSILNLCDGIKGHSSLVNQLERAATSIGANIREANYAHSRPDFIAECRLL